MTEIEEAPDAASNIWKSCAVGNLAAVSQSLAASPNLVNTPDEEGHFPLHWAALNNQMATLQLLLARGANLHAPNRQGATALHWSIVRGSLPCMESLLRAGADKECADRQGFRPLHVAAQYDHPAAIFHLCIRWHATYDSKDTDSRTALHWAAYKGFQNSLRLLIVLGCNVLDSDSEGLTPLHWASMRGNTEAAAILVQAGGLSALEAVEHQGKTPMDLATEKAQVDMLRFLTGARSNLSSRARPRSKLLARLAALHFAPIVWAASIASVVIFHWCVVAPGALHMPAPLPWMSHLAIVTLVLHAVGSIFMALVNIADPGFIATKSKPAVGGRARAPLHEDLTQLDCPAMWAGRWEQLCVTCKIVRPLRAKHCHFHDRCIEKYDHFCPWVGNSIGRGNQHYFLATLILMCLCCITGYIITFGRMSQMHCLAWGPRRGFSLSAPCWWDVIWVVFNVPLLAITLALGFSQSHQVITNLTTNEAVNWPRYKHFHAKESEGDSSSVFKFKNPFDRGLFRNCHETCFPGDYPMMPTVLNMNDHRVLAEMRQRLQDHIAPHQADREQQQQEQVTLL